jgi:hypothetical protein
MMFSRSYWCCSSLLVLSCLLSTNGEVASTAYTLLTKQQTECELEALTVGSMLADRYNSHDEATEWDTRIHDDYMTQHLGFAGWIQMGTYRSGGKTANGRDAKVLHRQGGWAGQKAFNTSAYWALENQWLYMMGDSTQRQIWATFVSPFQNNDFERNAKEWSREHCARQYPHRKVHASGGNFPEEGWSGKCGNNEVTCDLPGFGADGKITFDWKHFSYDDYDEWLFGEGGKWSNDTTIRAPDILTFEVGLHTCVHGYDNATTVKRHEDEVPLLMTAVHGAIQRHKTIYGKQTMVIVSTGGRGEYGNVKMSECSWRFNRILAHEAHKRGFVVLEREEIERRLLFRSEHYVTTRSIKPVLHLENPASNIIATSLLVLISCLRKNETSQVLQASSSSLTHPSVKVHTEL